MPPPSPTSPGATSRGTTSSTSSNPSARLPLTPTAAAAASKTQPVPGRAAGAKTPPNPIAIALGALVVVLAVVLGVMWFRSHRAATPAAPVDTVGVHADAHAATADADASRIDRARRDAVNDASARRLARRDTDADDDAERTAGGHSAAGRAGGTDGSRAAGCRHHGRRSSGSPAASPGTPGARLPTPTPRPASPAIDAAPVVFNDVKYIHVQGDKGDDQDARLIFGGGLIQVLSRNKDQAFTSEPYRQLARATYVRAKNPKWDPSLAGPPPTIDLSGFCSGTRGTGSSCSRRRRIVILRLDDSNWQHDSRHVRNADRPQGRSAAEHGQVSGRARDVHPPLRRPRRGQDARAAPGRHAHRPPADVRPGDRRPERVAPSREPAHDRRQVLRAGRGQPLRHVRQRRARRRTKSSSRPAHAEARRGDVHARAARPRAGAAHRRSTRSRKARARSSGQSTVEPAAASDGHLVRLLAEMGRTLLGTQSLHGRSSTASSTSRSRRCPAERAFLMLRDSADEAPVGARAAPSRRHGADQRDAQPARSCGA